MSTNPDPRTRLWGPFNDYILRMYVYTRYIQDVLEVIDQTLGYGSGHLYSCKKIGVKLILSFSVVCIFKKLIFLPKTTNYSTLTLKLQTNI